MTYRTLFSHIFMSILFCCYSSTIVSAQKMMNTQQMQDFEKELEEANKAIEEYVSSLSPAEQAEFNRQVEEMSRVLENMNEDEFEKFLGEMFADEPITEPNPFIDVQPITEPVVETTALSNEDKKKVETALKVLDDIIKQSNLFMVLVNSSPELPNRITRWGTRGVINNWQTGSKWDGFKLELESLIQKLYKVEEQDLDKKYKYLLELIADESLYNNLIQLQTSLNKLVPTINLPEFGIQKLSDQSKNAIKEILNKYSESFYLLGIPKALDTLFEKYAPEAEKLRSAEEAGTKRAQEAARGVRTPSSAETAGVGQENFGYDYGYGYPQYYGGDYGYNPYDSYNPYGGYSDYGYGSEGGSGAGAGNKGGAGGNGGGGSSGAGGGKGGQEDKDKDKGKSTGSTKAVPNLEIENAISTIKTDLADIKNALVDEEGKPTKLEKLTKTVESKEDNDLDIFAGTTLATTVDKKLDAIAKSLKTIDQKRLSSAELSHYQREVQKAFDKNKKDLEMLDNALKVFGTADDIKKAKDAATKAKLPETEKENVTPNTDISKLSGTKQWAFFGGDVTKVPVPEEGKEGLEKTIEKPVSLLDTKKKLDKLFADMKKFMSKKS
ncbi:MAG TPA: hypothetical protein VHX42_01155, partial [Candidatus Babeliales bacterium]|nr:hypothetical protein [Candidatus Babeliales bacterium]